MQGSANAGERAAVDVHFLSVLLPLICLALFPIAKPAAFSIDTETDARYTAIPQQIGEWTGRDVELDDRTYEILETRNVLSRVYENRSGETIHLLLVTSSKDRRVAHPPEVCYLSSHYEISKTADGQLEVGDRQIPIKQFTAHDQRQRSGDEEILYFYKVGDRFTANYYAQQFQFALDRLTRKASQVTLIRLAGRPETQFEAFLLEVLRHLP